MKIATLAALILLGLSWQLSAEKFLADDPIWRDQDCQAIPTSAEVEFSKTYNLMKNTFGSPGEEEEKRAVNVNTLGEVPDSSWFTNRIGRTAMSVDDLV